MEGISYSTVCNYVAWRLPQILAEAGRGPPPEVPIDQIRKPGVEAEVDFGDVWVDLAGVRTTCYLFAFRMSYSGKAVHRVTASCGQEAFFEGHAHALSVLGGVPTGKVRYDNLKVAVAQVVGSSRARVENERWVAFRSPDTNRRIGLILTTHSCVGRTKDQSRPGRSRWVRNCSKVSNSGCCRRREIAPDQLGALVTQRLGGGLCGIAHQRTDRPAAGQQLAGGG